MGTRGPPPTPTPILKQRGSWRAQRNPAEPRPEPERPRCPRWLSKEAKAAWRQLVPRLHALGVATRLDRNALARYCTLHARWQKAEQFLDEHGDVFLRKDEEGRVKDVRPYPQVRTAAQLAEQLLRLEAQFGMTPAARARLITPQPDRQPDGKDKSRFLRIA